MNDVTLYVDVSRHEIVREILNLKAKYDRLFWSVPNRKFEQYVLELADMTDRELVNRYNELSEKYHQLYRIEMVMENE